MLILSESCRRLPPEKGRPFSHRAVYFFASSFELSFLCASLFFSRQHSSSEWMEKTLPPPRLVACCSFPSPYRSRSLFHSSLYIAEVTLFFPRRFAISLDDTFVRDRNRHGGGPMVYSLFSALPLFFFFFRATIPAT